MDIFKKYRSLKYMNDIKWNDIFSVWRAYEAYQEDWKKHWKERGFNSWEEWRKDYVNPINPDKKEWKIYKIKDLNDVGEFYGVPSRGWIGKCYGGEITKKIDDIINYPIVKNNDKVREIINNFPYQTMLTGIMHEGKIVLVEGMHRALALAIMERDNVNHRGDVVIALAEHKGEISKIGKGNDK